MRKALLAMATLMAGLSAGAAQAQYYPPPAYGYGPPGSRCDAFLRTPYGPRRVLCPMGRPKPVGARCECSPSDPYTPPAFGRVIP